MYKALIPFQDLEDPEKTNYKVGDTFPREGVKPTKARIKELLSDKNKAGRPVIETVIEAVEEATEEE